MIDHTQAVQAFDRYADKYLQGGAAAWKDRMVLTYRCNGRDHRGVSALHHRTNEQIFVSIDNLVLNNCVTERTRTGVEREPCRPCGKPDIVVTGPSITAQREEDEAIGHRVYPRT